MPVARGMPSVDLVKVIEKMKSCNIYGKLYVERMNGRYIGARMKRLQRLRRRIRSEVYPVDIPVCPMFLSPIKLISEFSSNLAIIAFNVS